MRECCEFCTLDYSMFAWKEVMQERNCTVSHQSWAKVGNLSNLSDGGCESLSGRPCFLRCHFARNSEFLTGDKAVSCECIETDDDARLHMG